jgi:hypothetical protein
MENEGVCCKYHWKKLEVGDDKYMYIFNKFNPENNLKESRESMEPENSLKARKRRNDNQNKI